MLEEHLQRWPEDSFWIAAQLKKEHFEAGNNSFSVSPWSPAALQAFEVVCSPSLVSGLWLLYHSVPQSQESLSPASRPLPSNVDQMSVAAAETMFSLGDQLILQLLKANTFVSSPRQTLAEVFSWCVCRFQWRSGEPLTCCLWLSLPY